MAVVPPVTVLISCKNERSNVGPCLDAARGLGNEVLVADSGSTDGTLEYLRRRGDCRVIEREYVTAGDFKNWAIPQASHSWILVVDADERVTPALAAEIRELFRKGAQYDGYWVNRSNHLFGHRLRYTDWGRDRVLRLFRRDVCYYAGPSDHGEVVVTTNKIGRLRAPLDHLTTWSWDSYMKKFDRYTRLQAEEWHANGRKPSYVRMFFNPPLRFLRDFVLYRGFLDGAPGLQISLISAFYSFMKQARLWELHHGLEQSDIEGAAMEIAERKAA